MAKSCSVCRAEKALDEFQARSASPDGKRPECRICVSALGKEYYQRRREAIKAKAADYYRENRHRIRTETAPRYYESHKTITKARARKWKSEHPDVVRSDTRNRRAKRKACPGRHTAGQTAALLSAQGSLCANPYCFADLELTERHLDHATPVASGGSNGIENLQWLCKSCNTAKGSISPLGWMLKIIAQDVSECQR